MSNWNPVENVAISDATMRQTILEHGLVKLPKISDEKIRLLKEAFNRTHVKHEDGMFYSLYSKDYSYRKQTDELIFNTLKEELDVFLTNYKSVFNLFIVKGAHTKDEFFIHQDPSYVDETKYSPLHVWIPLDDVDETNGAICYVPKSHKFFAPYRSISFAPPYENIRADIRPYLQPVFMKAGEVLVFDPRVLHNSLPNNTDQTRVAMLLGIFPQEAQIIACYRDEEVPNAPVELFKEQEDFFLTYPDFYETCRMRPNVGDLVATLPYNYAQVTAQQFAAMCSAAGVEPTNFLQVEELDSCKMIGEPDVARKLTSV